MGRRAERVRSAPNPGRLASTADAKVAADGSTSQVCAAVSGRAVRVRAWRVGCPVFEARNAEIDALK